MKNLLRFIAPAFAMLALSSWAAQWQQYPAVSAPGLSDTFLIGTLTTNQQISAANYATWVLNRNTSGVLFTNTFAPGMQLIVVGTNANGQMIVSATNIISGGDMLRSQNLADVANAATARDNIGADNASNLTLGTLGQARLPAMVVTNNGNFSPGLLKAGAGGDEATNATPSVDYSIPSDVATAQAAALASATSQQQASNNVYRADFINASSPLNGANLASGTVSSNSFDVGTKTQLFTSGGSGALPVLVTLDDDASSDTTSVPGLDMLARLQGDGICQLLLVACPIPSTVNYGITSMERVFSYHSVFPLYAVSTNALNFTDTDVYTNFYRLPSFLGYPTNAMEAVSAYRKVLASAAQKNRKVRMIFTGELYNLNDLLNSSPDSYSALYGSNLVAATVEWISIMGGDYPNGHEWNFYNGMVGRPATCCVSNIPSGVKVFYIGFTDGAKLNVAAPYWKSKVPTDSPYYLTAYGSAWDEVSTLIGVFGTNYYSTNLFICTEGTNNIVGSGPTAGSNYWTSGSGSGQFYLTNVPNSIPALSNIVNQLAVLATSQRGYARPLLLSPMTYFVSPSGSDANDGLTTASPLLSIQTAVNKALRYDFNTNNITIQLADGSYSGSVLVQQHMGNSDWKDTQGELIIHGNDSAPSNVVVTNASTNHLFLASKGARLSVRSLAVGAANRTDSDLFDVQIASSLNVSNLVMGPCGSSAIQIISEAGGWFWQSGPYTIKGGGLAHFVAQSGGSIWLNQAVTLSGIPNFTLAFAQAYSGGSINLDGGSFSGAATGARYDIHAGGSVVTFGVTGVDTLFPGNSPGVQDMRMLELSGQPFTATNGIFGTVNGSSAPSGVIGEYMTAIVGFTGRSILTSNIVSSVTNIVLTPGDWDVTGQATFSDSGSTIIGQRQANISPQVSAISGPGVTIYSGITTGIGADTLTLPPFRVNTPTNCTVYLSVLLQFNGGTPGVYGEISARRMR